MSLGLRILNIPILNVTTSVCLMALWIKYFAVVIMDNKYSSQSNDSPKVDDEKLVTESNNNDSKRFWFITLNDIENIPMTLLMYFAAYLSTLADNNGQMALIVLLPIYTFSRMVHSWAFAKANLLLRGAAHFICLGCTIAFGLMSVIQNIRYYK